MTIRAISNLYVVILLFVFTSAVSFSQEAVLQKNYNGLATITFNTPKGDISIHIPEHVKNEQISGSIYIVANGNSNTKTKKNKASLEQFQLTYGDLPISLESKIFSLNTADLKNGLLVLKNSIGKVIASSTITFPPKNKTSIVTTQIPSYLAVGQSGKIHTKLDGFTSNTSVSINNNNAPVLAESETDLYFEVPSNISGVSQIQIINEEQTIDRQVNVLLLEISADRLNLSRGETTSLTIEISGLEELQTEVHITITNNSPSNISLEGGNNQEITIQPDSGDTYELSQTISATQGGDFSISASILPSNETNVHPNNELLCNCVINNYSYLISSEACAELGGHCIVDENEMLSSYKSELPHNPMDAFIFNIKQLSIDNDIEDLEDDIEDKWGKWDRAKHNKDSLSDLHSDLVVIDKVLDRVPQTYKDRLKKAVDALEDANGLTSEEVSNAALDKAIADAQANLDACKKRISELEALIKQQEKDLEALEEEMNTLLDDLNKVLDDFCIDNSCKASLTKKSDGTFSFDYDIPKEADGSDRDYISELTSAIFNATSKHRRALKTHKKTLENLEDAKDDCVQLAEALSKAKEAKANADYKAAKELELEEQCEQLKRILKRLKNWCENHPDHCDFMDDINDLIATCPKTADELDEFWKDFDALVAKKKELEDSLDKSAEDAQSDMDEIEDEVADLENDISSLEEQKRKKYLEDQARKQKIAQAEAKEAAAAKAASDKRKKKKNQQKKDDDKIKDLIKNAKSDNAGDDAFKNLLKGMGLDLLDKATGNAKLGKIIGGILVVKNMPDCACKMFEMLQQAIRAQLNGQDLFRFVFTNEYIRQWNSCANLPVFSSIMIGSEELSNAIGGMSKAQCRKAIEALDQAMRVQCK